MTEEHVDSLIPYDDVVQEALRAVVGRVLGDVARDGLPGDHHFYITFKTQAPGVAIPQHLHERFPDEMTIVLQHKYWDLKVEAEHFEVGLSFSQIPSHLVYPIFRHYRLCGPRRRLRIAVPRRRWRSYPRTA